MNRASASSMRRSLHSATTQRRASPKAFCSGLSTPQMAMLKSVMARASSGETFTGPSQCGQAT
ncbi:MAG: hypothetical protein QOE90_1765 [Thermoplasmata archaeon]|nr:hypothetical protein [Thermoplasmata archaeon]